VSWVDSGISPRNFIENFVSPNSQFRFLEVSSPARTICQVSSTSTQRSWSLRVVKMLTPHGRTFHGFYKSYRERWLKISNKELCGHTSGDGPATQNRRKLRNNGNISEHRLQWIAQGHRTLRQLWTLVSTGHIVLLKLSSCCHCYTDFLSK